MFRKFVVLTTTALIVAVVGLTGASAALAASGAGPDNAATLPGSWVKLDAGARVWYAFQYGGDGSPIDVRVASDTANALAFSIWTPGDLAQWAATGEENPVGRGSVNDQMGGDLFWTGNFNQAGSYYVVIDSTGNVPVDYLPQISGAAVYVAPAVAPVANATPTQVATAPTVASKPAKSGVGPDDALAISGNWMPLAAGQWTWYAFDYPGDDSQFTIRMTADPANPDTFSVWTPAEVTHWAQDGTIDPVGRGSDDPFLGDDLVWSGHFNTPGTYYVVVANATAAPSNYRLTIN